MKLFGGLLGSACVLASACSSPDDPRLDKAFFTLYDLAGWDGDRGYWFVEQKQLIGQTTSDLSKDEFLFSTVEVDDFYLSVWVLQRPSDRNSGIQFRSIRDSTGHAVGYQADIGKGYWGRIYEEHGRGQLDWTDAGEKHVKPNDWNHYEILAVDQRIWTAINGHLAAALDDPQGARTGYIALQIHFGPPQEIRFRDLKLIHHPGVELAGLNEEQLNQEVRMNADEG